MLQQFALREMARSSAVSRLLKNGNSSNAASSIKVTTSYSGISTPTNSNYTFGTTPLTLIIPILPGTITVTFYGPQAAVLDTAIVTVTYYR